jgi:glycosyltransferase involved in cell wall biosynthesis
MIVGTTCVNYAEYLREGLEAMSKLCDTIFVLDDDPTGEVEAVTNDFPKVDWRRWYEPYHEAKTRALGLKVALVDHNADWVLPFDGDEVLHNPEHLLQDIQAHSWGGGGANCIQGHTINFWDSREFYRADSLYANRRSQRMFYVRDQRDVLVKAAEEWARTGAHCHAGYMFGGRWRCGPVSTFKIKHYAFVSSKRRREKYEHYIRFAPGRDYSHMLDEKVPLERWEP